MSKKSGLGHIFLLCRCDFGGENTIHSAFYRSNSDDI